MNRVVKIIFYSPIFLIGYLTFLITNKTIKLSYISFRQLYCLTNGGINQIISRILQISNSKKEIIKDSIINISDNEIHFISEKIKKDGFYIFEEKINKEICDKLVEFACTSPAFPIPNPLNLPDHVYNPNNLIAPKYQFDEQKLFEQNSVQKLVSDGTLLSIAQQYLESIPINDSVTMWWSTCFSKNASSEAAQLYHFDMDRIKFIKFFVYLTDVTSSTGPHCYVRTSNGKKHENLLIDKRFSDEVIKRYYKDDDFVEISGEKGTLIAADTSGFHKGKPLFEGERLIFQIEYTNSLFGQKYNKITINEKFTEAFQEKISYYKKTFQRFVLPQQL